MWAQIQLSVNWPILTRAVLLNDYQAVKNRSFTSTLYIAYNANVERIFSLMQLQWSKRERFLFDSVASILKLVYNFNNVTCNQFYDTVKADSTLLKKLRKRSNTRGLSRKIKCNNTLTYS